MVLQSVLVTVDRHEWYATPQIYTRDDSSGLWTVKPAFQPDSVLMPTNVNGETQSLKQIHTSKSQEFAGGVANREIDCKNVSTECHWHDEPSNGSKKRRLAIEMCTDEIAVDCSIHESREVKQELGATESVPRDYHGAVGTPANASVAEHVIEPTLVMLEVCF